MYNEETYVFLNIPKMIEELNQHEHTIRGYVNSFLNEKLLLKMNYKDYNYALPESRFHNLYKLNLNTRSIDDVLDTEIHPANKYEIKKDAQSR